MDTAQSSILVVLVAGIGDIVLGSMGLRAMRNGHPLARIHLLTSADAAMVAKNYPYIDRVWAFPIRRLRHDKTAIVDMLKVILTLRSHWFDKVVNLYPVASIGGGLTMGTVFSLLRSSCKVGHDCNGFGNFLDRKGSKDFFQGRHMADSMLEMARLAGGKPDGKGVEVFRSGRIDPAMERVLDSSPEKPRPKIIAINAGSDAEYKRADPAVFSLAVERIAALFPVQTIVLGGPGEEAIAGRIVRSIDSPAVNLAGKISLEALVCVLEQVDLLITNDSGPMHIAAALKKPLVALFAGGNPAVFGPYGDPLRFRIIEMDRAGRNKRGPSIKAAAEQVAAFSEELLCGR
jgi:ADP-heptose:LPS heptosyltransferase